MSKSDPNSAIFMEDSEVEVSTKIKKAYCPPKVRPSVQGSRVQGLGR
jgi:tryptophanyl-tRNA synthetase